MKKTKLSTNNKGFTLIEIMVVVIIIGTLAAIAIPQFAKQSDRAKEKAAIADLKSFKNAVEMYYADHAMYPTAENDSVGIEEALREYGITWPKTDPWGEEKYVYYFNSVENNDPEYFFMTKSPVDAPDKYIFCSSKQDPTLDNPNPDPTTNSDYNSHPKL